MMVLYFLCNHVFISFSQFLISGHVSLHLIIAWVLALSNLMYDDDDDDDDEDDDDDYTFMLA